LVAAKGIQMKNILIISPHYPPSNLAAVHRSRLFAQHLPAFGWTPIILAVHEDFYEEALDWKLHKLIPADQRIEKVTAFKVGKPRLVGDIGLRAYFQLRRKALEFIRAEKIDFVYIPIPSFYMALLGPYLFKRTGIPYGIDYIDPWVHQFPGSNKLFSRHWFSTQLAKLLEPIAIKHAALITGVSEGYYKPVLDRNPHLKTQALTAAMPYGGEESDHDFIRAKGKETSLPPQPSAGKLNPSTTSTTSTPSTIKFIYAGAMLPKAYKPLEEIFKALSQLQPPSLGLPTSGWLASSTLQPLQPPSTSLNLPQSAFHFIGTLGTVKPIAEKYGLYGTTVVEHPDRIPYLDVLTQLEAADAVFILGSTEPHYTPSKVYQGVLSGKPILAVLHEQSTAVNVLRASNAGIVITMKGEEDLDTLSARFLEGLREFEIFRKAFDPNRINRAAFEQYSAKAVTAQLVDKLDEIVSSTAGRG
jgi:glycosyltransferase involved in cell wall biosynthesis